MCSLLSPLRLLELDLHHCGSTMVRSLAFLTTTVSLLSCSAFVKATGFAERRAQSPFSFATFKPAHGNKNFDNAYNSHFPLNNLNDLALDVDPNYSNEGGLSGTELPVWEPTNTLNDFVPELKDLSATMYTRVKHPFFPQYSVRIKRTTGWCDDSVEGFTGYIDVGAKHLFFYYFESRAPSDDLILWTNGGPGCSSELGLLMELGPCRIKPSSNENDSPTVEFNPFSWNNNASLIFIDQPVGVGFSYADYGEHVGRTEEAAKDVAAFVAIFMETFIRGKRYNVNGLVEEKVTLHDKHEHVKFHLAGESYGGRYIPVFAAEVVDLNPKLEKVGIKPVPLKSVLIGNGITDFATMATSYYDVTCTGATLDPFLPVTTCARMRIAIPRCEELLRKECLDRFDSMSCLAAAASCAAELEEPFFMTGRNPYDISRPCDGPIEQTLCYPITLTIREYLDLPEIRKKLGVSPKVGRYYGCSRAVGEDFYTHADRVRYTAPYVEGLLERGIKVLIYVGTYDWICNHVGNYRWTSALKWTGERQFNKEELREWTVDGKVAGKTRSANGLTFATVDAAGHMVPYDKPVQALAMLNRWLARKPL